MRVQNDTPLVHIWSQTCVGFCPADTLSHRLCKLEDDLAAAVAATVQERVQTMMKTRRADQQAKVGPVNMLTGIGFF